MENYWLFLGLKKFFSRRKCLHKNTRCIHAAEILGTHRWRKPTMARVCCMDCNRYLYDRELPVICSRTGEFHLSRRLK